MQAGPFTPTPAMIKRHLAWVDEYATAIWDHWEETGQIAAAPEEADKAIQVVRSEMLVTTRPDWMHPLDSIAILTAAPECEGEPLQGQVRIERADAMRTSAGLGQSGRSKWMGKVMGISAHSAMRYAPADRRRNASVDPNRRTAVYRHYDKEGTLLYVGCSVDPTFRFVLHAYTAAWHSYSAKCDVEWYHNRADALRAERAAIESEDPIFNVRDSRLGPGLAEAYLAQADMNLPNVLDNLPDDCQAR